MFGLENPRDSRIVLDMSHATLRDHSQTMSNKDFPCPGSMADVPKDLLAQIKELERTFLVDGEKLKEITNHFVSELERGMDLEGHILKYFWKLTK